MFELCEPQASLPPIFGWFMFIPAMVMVKLGHGLRFCFTHIKMPSFTVSTKTHFYICRFTYVTYKHNEYNAYYKVVSRPVHVCLLV